MQEAEVVETKDGIKVHCAFDELVPIENVQKNPRNPNIHPDEQLALLAKVIRHSGFRAPITVSTRSGYIVRGHGRLESAKIIGCVEVPIDYQNYDSESDELADLIADNRIAELAERDGTRLKDILEELNTGAMDMDLTGYTDKQLERLMTATIPAEVSTLRSQFIVPPFSILDARNAEWQEKKREWLASGIKSELGRGASNKVSPSGSPMAGKGKRKKYKLSSKQFKIKQGKKKK